MIRELKTLLIGLYRWLNDGRLTETCCHNKLKYTNIVVFDGNQKVFYFLLVSLLRIKRLAPTFKL